MVKKQRFWFYRFFNKIKKKIIGLMILTLVFSALTSTIAFKHTRTHSQMFFAPLDLNWFSTTTCDINVKTILGTANSHNLVTESIGSSFLNPNKHGKI